MIAQDDNVHRWTLPCMKCHTNPTFALSLLVVCGPGIPNPICNETRSDGQSCFPAGLRGPVFLGFSLALINSGVPPLPPCPFGPCPTPPLPREPGPCILRPFPPPATLGVPPEAGLWNLRVCPSSLRLCGALRTLDSGFCASNSGALCWRPSGLRTVDSGWVAEGMARSPDSGFWIV